MKLIFLGSGGSWPTRDRNTPSVALKIDGEILLFDCGEGTQRQMIKHKVNFMKVSKIFVTHFHGDHFLGIPGLLQTMGLNQRRAPLTIYSPDNTEKRVEMILNLGYYTLDFDVKGITVGKNDVLDFGKYFIKTAEAKHSVPSVAYCFEEKMRRGRFLKEKAISLGVPEGKLFGKLQRDECVVIDGKVITPDMVTGPPRKGMKVVVTGDTAPSEEIINLAKNADVLVHEATGAHDMRERAHKYGHSTTVDAAEVAKRANVRMLIIYHISPRYSIDDDESLLKEAREIFPKTYIARDFAEFELKYKC